MAPGQSVVIHCVCCRAVLGCCCLSPRRLHRAWLAPVAAHLMSGPCWWGCALASPKRLPSWDAPRQQTGKHRHGVVQDRQPTSAAAAKAAAAVTSVVWVCPAPLWCRVDCVPCCTVGGWRGSGSCFLGCGVPWVQGPCLRGYAARVTCMFCVCSVGEQGQSCPLVPVISPPTVSPQSE